MTPERCDQVIARVVAWHNRHPLATRITPAQVHSVGVVSLPYAEPAGPAEPVQAVASADEGADHVADAAGAADAADAGHGGRGNPLGWWRRRRRAAALHLLAREDFLPPWPPQRVWRWVATHGVPWRPLEADAPLRQVAPDPAWPRPDGAWRDAQRQVITAAIGVDDQRHRLLLAPGARGPVLGTRHRSRQRSAAAAGGVVAAALALGAGLWWSPGPPSAVMATHPVPSVVPVPALAAAVDADSKPQAGPEADAQPAAVVAGVPPAGAAGADRPADVDPRAGTIAWPPLVPSLDPAQRQALRHAGQALRSGAAPAPAPRAWALVSMPMSDRPRSQRVAAQLRAVALLQAVPMQAELMQVAGRWRAVCWPFATAHEAEKVRLALADKGLQTEVIEF